ncbi:hypothetical protein [Pedobacter glucosidilyticus]|uniref:hypothetical protein n=1 Tax=Pedobacter glucosidilyticus TaxID=1122941 RepID=UPI0039C9F410
MTNFTPTTGSVGTLVTITNLNNPTSITIGGSKAIPMSNHGSNHGNARLHNRRNKCNYNRKYGTKLYIS